MENRWTMSVWGVRGAIPKADRNYLNYGGNTSCFLADCGEDIIIFDAGTGLLSLSGLLQSKKCRRIHILLSHLHLDHIIGLPAFPLLYDPEAEIHLYGLKPEYMTLEAQLCTAIGPPYWPLGLKNCQARLCIHEICAGESFSVGSDIHVSTLFGSHPDPCLYYRLDGSGKSIVYALDCELKGAIEERLTAFCKNCYLLVWDANFTPEDIEGHRGWGHSTWAEGIQLGSAANVKQILATHYDPRYNDSFLQEQEYRAKQTCNFIKFAREGMEITL